MESSQAVLQEGKYAASNISSSEIKIATVSKSLQSKTISVTTETNRLSSDYYKPNTINRPNNGEMDSYDSPKHDSGDTKFKHTFKDEASRKNDFPISWQVDGRNDVGSSYHKMENMPFIVKDVIPVTEKSLKNGLSYFSVGQNDGNVMVAQEDIDSGYPPQHRLKPYPPISKHKYHYQSSDQNKKNKFESVVDSRTQVEDGGRTFDDPQWKTFQKIFLQNGQNDFNNVLNHAKTYQRYQPLHTHRYPDQQLHAINNELYYSNNPKKIIGVQQEEEEEAENFNTSQERGRAETMYRKHLPSPYMGENDIVKRNFHSMVRRKVSSGDITKSVNTVDLLLLERGTSSRTILRNGASDSTLTRFSSSEQSDAALTSHLNSTDETSNNSVSVVNSMYAQGIQYFSTLQGFSGSKYGSWSSVYYTVIAISMFLEMGCQSTFVWILRICVITTKNTSVLIKEITMSFQILVGWSLVVCPLVGLIVVLSPCPYQITAHLVAAAVLTLCVLFLLPLVSPISRSRKRKPSKPSYREIYEGFPDTLMKRFSSSLRMGITGCIIACNLEFMMWYMETQETFTHNYEYLYCGYSATASLTHFLVNRFLRKRTGAAEDVESETEDEMEAGSWQPRSREGTGYEQWWWLWEAGTLVLGVQQLAAQLHPVWVLPALLGVLQGAGYALSFGGSARSMRTSYSIGYGCGCLAAGLIVQKWGAAVLFQVVGLGSAVCAAVAAIVRGVAQCNANRRQVKEYSFSIASAESDAGSDGEENEIVETDDWLVQALQQDEYRHAKKNHRLEC